MEDVNKRSTNRHNSNQKYPPFQGEAPSDNVCGMESKSNIVTCPKSIIGIGTETKNCGIHHHVESGSASPSSLPHTSPPRIWTSSSRKIKGVLSSASAPSTCLRDLRGILPSPSTSPSNSSYSFDLHVLGDTRASIETSRHPTPTHKLQMLMRYPPPKPGWRRVIPSVPRTRSIQVKAYRWKNIVCFWSRESDGVGVSFE